MNTNKTKNVKQIIESHENRTTNHEGGIAYKLSDKMALYSMVASWLVGEPKFYADTEDERQDYTQDQKIIGLIQKVAVNEPQFVLKLAVYARNVLYLRTAPQVLLVECSLIDSAKPFIRKYTPHVVKRADELTSCVAYLQSRIGHIGSQGTKGSMPAGLKKGLGDAFNNFSAYQLQKYNNKRRAVKLVDVLKLVHPKPKDDNQSQIFKQLKEDKLPTPKTWETIVSAKGSNIDSWTEASKVMPYMAALRNLRNLINNKVELRDVLNKIKDPAEIRKSKQFPFRYFSAYREVENGTESFETSEVLDSLETALTFSVDNVPKIKGTTIISADNSASMRNKISEKSSVSHQDIANLFLAIASRICEKSIASIFGNSFTTKVMPKSAGIISNMQKIQTGEVGHSTNAYLAIEYLRQNKIKADRFILFSDMQCYDSSPYGWSDKSVYEEVLRYRNEVNHDFRFYSVDLNGYGTAQTPENDPKTLLIAGWSDKILKYIPIFEAEGKTALNEIDSISIS